MLNCLWVGLGGFAGSVFRYLLSLIPLSKAGAFPVMTLVTNVAGALVIGMIVGLGEKSLSPGAMLFLKVGVCGGFTTFSTFALETSNLFSSGKAAAAFAYIVLSVVLCLAAVVLGRSLIKA